MSAWDLEASTGIEPVYTDLQSFAFTNQTKELDEKKYQDIRGTSREPDTLPNAILGAYENEGPGAAATASEANKKASELPSDTSTAPTVAPAFPAQAKWKDANPRKVWAHAALRSGLRRGLVTRDPCEVCGKPEVDGHHDDYDRPLAVRWLCRRHHKAVHTGRAV